MVISENGEVLFEGGWKPRAPVDFMWVPNINTKQDYLIIQEEYCQAHMKFPIPSEVIEPQLGEKGESFKELVFSGLAGRELWVTLSY
jgi:hypothetical protein